MGKQKFTLYLLIFLGAVWVSSTPSYAQSLSDSTIVMGTPHDIENGKGYIRNYYLNYNLVGIGIGKHAFLRAGFGIVELINLRETAYYFQPSISAPISDRVKLTVGVGFSQYHRELSSRTIDTEFSVKTRKGLLQFGMSIGVMEKYSETISDFRSQPSFKLNYALHITRKSLLIFENRTFQNLIDETVYLDGSSFGRPLNTSNSSTDFVSSFTYRVLNNKAGFDLGFIAFYNFPTGGDFILPHFGFVIPFDRFTE
ncbi:MAG: hypothetical protein JJ966_02825 [Balneolaceae bacterium]|nr:hypothetical protein [Balneolaceae bacterium]